MNEKKVSILLAIYCASVLTAAGYAFLTEALETPYNPIKLICKDNLQYLKITKTHTILKTDKHGNTGECN